MLLQGETSVGKTSLIHWLAAATGNKCVRINNHEHTDIQEYVGTYSADSAGNLVFKEGKNPFIFHQYLLFIINMTSEFICLREIQTSEKTIRNCFGLKISRIYK